MIVKPFVKWAGGKAKQLPLLLEVLPQKCNTYFEPFLGGGALFWALASKKYFQQAIINDTNNELITTYREIRSNIKYVIEKLKFMKVHHSEDYYYRVRNTDSITDVGCAARFIYLNKTGFNGLYRVNKSGIFNVPWGKRDSSVILDEENLVACNSILQNYLVDIS